MATNGEIGLSQPAASTITMKIRTVTQAIGSTTVHQELLTLAGAESSLEIARVIASAPASTEYGLAVRIASGPSSAADLLARVNQGVGNSSAADRWNVAAMPGSTVWASSAGFHFDSSGALNVAVVSGVSTIVTVARQVGNSSAADYMPARLVDSSGTGFHGPANPVPFAVTDSSNAVVKSGDSANNAIRVNVVAGAAGGSTIVTVSTGSVRVGQSTAADLQATVTPVAGSTWRTQPGSTLWASSAGFHFNSSGELQVVTAVAGSTLVSLSVPASWNTVAVSTALQSTSTPIISSAATRPYIAAYTVASTEAGPIMCAFMEGSTVLWPVLLWADGGQPSVTAAVGPTSFIFAGSANRPISFNIISGSTGTAYVAVTYKQE